MHSFNFSDRGRLAPGFATGVLWTLVAGAVVLLAGCYAPPQARPAATGAALLLVHRFAPAATAATAPAAVAEVTPVTATMAATAPISGTVATAAAPAGQVATVPLTDTVPVALAIPAIDWSVPVVPMGWEAVLVEGKPVTRWLVPGDAGGWAVNSAAPGAAGNMVIAGQQAAGEGLFRPLALGEVAAGQVVEVEASDGAIHRYQVMAVSPPIPAIGATAEEQATAAAYLAAGESAQLTLVTGWPADVSTHRIFVVAEYVGTAP